jgi:hypothetical protein
MDGAFDPEEEWWVFPVDGEDEELDDFNLLREIVEQDPGLFEGNRSLFDTLNAITNSVMENYGEGGIYSMMCSIEANTGWSIEIVTSKNEIEKYLWDRYAIFDDTAWSKSRQSKEWQAMLDDFYHARDRWMPIVLASVTGQKVKLRDRIRVAWRALTR